MVRSLSHAVVEQHGGQSQEEECHLLGAVLSYLVYLHCDCVVDERREDWRLLGDLAGACVGCLADVLRPAPSEEKVAGRECVSACFKHADVHALNDHTTT